MKFRILIIVITLNIILNPLLGFKSLQAGNFGKSFNKSFRESYNRSSEHTYRKIEEERKIKRQHEQDKLTIQIVIKLNDTYETYISSLNKQPRDGDKGLKKI